MAETDTPPVTTEETLVPSKTVGMPLLERWVQSDPEAALKRVETMVSVLERLRLAAIRATYPSDWLIHVSRTAAGEIISQKGYLQDIGAERAGKIWGIEVSQPAIEREDFPDSTFSYHMVAEAWSKITGERLDYVEGSRWSGDGFFRKSVGADEKTDPTDVRKSAYANLHGRAVRALTGLNGVPLDMLRQAGLDISKVVHIDYEKGAKGGDSAGASVGDAEIVVAFGNAKGKRPAELEDRDLDWYTKAYEENVADPKKERFRKANDRVLQALRAEKHRRAQAVDHAAATGPKPAESAPPAEPAVSPRGKKIGDMYVRLTDACDNDQKVIAGVLRMVTTELCGAEKAALSDLTDAELDKLSGVPDDVLKKLAARAGGKK
jgi:hypothetical protein